MEILSKLWVAMTTENETIINILLILFLFIGHVNKKSDNPEV